jgi:hypothetical protein
VPIRAIRGESAVGSNCRHLADPKISVHLGFSCGEMATGRSAGMVAASTQ